MEGWHLPGFSRLTDINYGLKKTKIYASSGRFPVHGIVWGR